jgi:hypothetical protein
LLGFRVSIEKFGIEGLRVVALAFDVIELVEVQALIVEPLHNFLEIGRWLDVRPIEKVE